MRLWRGLPGTFSNRLPVACTYSAPMNIIITSPSLDPTRNISGMAALTQLIIDENKCHNYAHFELGKKDDESRGLRWFTGIAIAYIKWIRLVLTRRQALIHFNLALDNR